MFECEHCGQQIIWDDGEFVTLAGSAVCTGGREHKVKPLN